MSAPAADHDGNPAPLPGPLQGVRVLDVSTVYAAPITAMMLGDYGADVIKIEHPRGDPARTHGHNKNGHGLWWKVISRNKRTVTMNLGHPEGRDLLEGLVTDADVLIENFRPGVMEKWDLAPDRLHDINPALVILRVTGFGQRGPYARRRAFGTLAEAMSGFAHPTGQPDGPPTLPPFGLADGVAGLAATSAVLLALYHRRNNGGHGQVIDISLLEPLLTLLGHGPSVYDQLGIVPGRHSNRSPKQCAAQRLHDPRRTLGRDLGQRDSDRRARHAPGRAPRHRRAAVVSLRARAGPPRGPARRCGRPLVGARNFDEVMRAFEEAGAAIAPIYDIEQLMADPQVEALDAITTIEDEDLGPLRMQNLMFRLSESPGGTRFAGRRLGQDNEYVDSARLGLDAERIAELRERGAI